MPYDRNGNYYPDQAAPPQFGYGNPPQQGFNYQQNAPYPNQEYGGFDPQQLGQAAPGQHEGYRSALIQMPSSGQLGGKGPVPFVRMPFYPTSPFYSTNNEVGYQTRFYSTGVLYTDNDYTVGSEMIRTVQFDIPCRLIAFNGSAIYYFGSPVTVAALPVGVKPNDTYLFRMEYTTGDKLHISSRLGSTVVGSDENPGEIGGVGYNIDQGASVVIGITPLMANLRIDVTLVCLEMRGPRNFSR